MAAPTGVPGFTETRTGPVVFLGDGVLDVPCPSIGDGRDVEDAVPYNAPT